MDNSLKVNLFKDVAELINSWVELDRVLKVLVITATRVMNVKAASLLLTDKKTDGLYFHVAVGEKKEDVARHELKKGEGIAGWVVEHGKPLLVPDVSADPRWSPRIAEAVGFKTHSIACAPLKVHGAVIGVLEIIDRDDGSYLTDDDLDTLIAFSEMAALALYRAREYDDVTKEITELKKELRDSKVIVGDSPIIRRAIEDCRKVASSRATTLITGASGAGKELFARLIHDMSPRSDKPFIVVNCGALPETLLERELFGHEKGAFTGADSRKIGLFEAADKGTIFLDEIGETTPAMQVKLLRVLQESNFLRIGGQAPIQVDVRVIAATNKELEKLIVERRFREDLYYRLNVVRIKLPSLRERREDIPALAEHFLRKIAKSLGRPVKKFAREAMTALVHCQWPGNIRQLENAIERAVIMGETDVITLEDLPPDVTDIKNAGGLHPGLTLKDAQENFKKEFIIQTLAWCGGNKTKTAQVLDIQRTYLSRLLKELEIEG